MAREWLAERPAIDDPERMVWWIQAIQHEARDEEAKRWARDLTEMIHRRRPTA